jgi:hypothetical protein
MTLETRKINLINWISTLQDQNVLNKVEQIQKEASDWWENISDEDKNALNEGLNQLDKGEFITRSEVQEKIKGRFNF